MLMYFSFTVYRYVGHLWGGALPAIQHLWAACATASPPSSGKISSLHPPSFSLKLFPPVLSLRAPVSFSGWGEKIQWIALVSPFFSQDGKSCSESVHGCDIFWEKVSFGIQAILFKLYPLFNLTAGVTRGGILQQITTY